jgi:hypothetical protein
MSEVEREPAATRAKATGAEAPESGAPQREEQATNPSVGRIRRPAYTRPFRGFLEQLGENPREFDQSRYKL